MQLHPPQAFIVKGFEGIYPFLTGKSCPCIKMGIKYDLIARFVCFVYQHLYDGTFWSVNGKIGKSNRMFFKLESKQCSLIPFRINRNRSFLESRKRIHLFSLISPGHKHIKIVLHGLLPGYPEGLGQLFDINLIFQHERDGSLPEFSIVISFCTK